MRKGQHRYIKFVSGLFQHVLIPVKQGDLPTVCGHEVRRGKANTAGGTGDQGDFLCCISH